MFKVSAKYGVSNLIKVQGACANKRMVKVMERLKIRFRVSIILAAVSCMCIAGSSYGEESPTGSYTLPLRFMPYVDVSGVYDSNFFKTTEDEDSETYINALAGLDISYGADRIDILLSAFASARLHSDYDDDDFETYGQGLRLRYGSRDSFAIDANQAFRRVTQEDTFGPEVAIGAVSPDSVLDSASTLERDIFQAGVHLGVDPTDKTELDLSYRYDFVDYTSRTLDKITTQTAGIEIASRLTDKSSGIVMARYGVQGSDGLDDSADFYNAMIGMKTTATEKLNLRAAAGHQTYDRPGDLESKDSFVFDVEASLRTSDKVTLLAGGRNGTQLSSIFRGNSAEYTTYYVGAQMQATSSIRLSANAAYREDEYFDPVDVDGELVDRTDKGMAFSVRGDYQSPSDYLSFYTLLTFDSIESPAGDYDQAKVSLGLRLQY